MLALARDYKLVSMSQESAVASGQLLDLERAIAWEEKRAKESEVVTVLD